VDRGVEAVREWFSYYWGEIKRSYARSKQAK
jgi:hypothetical protein